MTADSMDLEDCDNIYKDAVSSMFDQDLGINLLNLSDLDPPTRFLDPDDAYFSPFNFIKSEDVLVSSHSSFEHQNNYTDSKSYSSYSNDSYLPTFENSSLYKDPIWDPEYLAIVSPNLVLPISEVNPPKIESRVSEPIEDIWPDISGLNDEKLVQIVDSGILDNNYITIDDILMKKKPRKFTHLEFDHCYSQRLPRECDEEEDDDDDYFNSFPNSPASSLGSDKVVPTKGVKRTRPKKKVGRPKKIKQEVLSCSEEEDVETLCSEPFVVPKITIALAPSFAPVPAKRGRKPKNKTEGQNVRKPNNKSCPVTPKILQAAIKQQTKRSYVTKSGRVTKISNSVETTPSTSTPSSLNNSRCNSDNEDNIDKRASHNMAERNRRQELTNLYQAVRVKVPEIKDNPKTSKVTILQTAVAYIGEVEDVERQKLLLKEQLRAEMETKLALVQSLRNSRRCSS